LKAIGYEDRNDWRESLPLDRADNIASTETAEPAPDTGGLVDVLVRRNELLAKDLTDKESQIQMLKGACDERLEINALFEKDLADKESQIQLLKRACDERLEAIEKLDAELTTIRKG
jgi:predicted RNase H-like nuclease (RuvC/YqgF family)